MNMLKRAVLLISIILATTLLSAVNISAQKSNMMISAVAMGTSTQMGRVINIDLRVFELSKPSDQQVLLEAFTSEGSQGLAIPQFASMRWGRSRRQAPRCSMLQA